MQSTNEWFTTWFSSPYYPILYNKRDESEANGFVSLLFSHLKLSEKDKILDLACGRGRHARAFHTLGAEVYGLDISDESILEAKKYASERLHFEIHDMRQKFPFSGFSAIFNLFTSFGYFDDLTENKLVIQNIKNSLKEDGLFIIDYLNVDYIIPRLIAKEVKTLQGIQFFIHKKVENGFIVKEIEIIDGEKRFHFVEKVQAISLRDFKAMFEALGLEITEIWGDYNGNGYVSNSSNRLIIFAKNNK
ncbi:MAG: class I SAM-dependent methyltransferase [Bacteroidia bacterium]